jgi:hypothetical protein
MIQPAVVKTSRSSGSSRRSTRICRAKGVADAGSDRGETYEMWFSPGVHFVVRQCEDCMVVTPNGTPIILGDFVEHLYQRGSAETLADVWSSAKSFCPAFVVDRRTWLARGARARTNHWLR